MIEHQREDGTPSFISTISSIGRCP